MRRPAELGAAPLLTGLLCCVCLLHARALGRWVRGDDLFKYEGSIEHGFQV